MNICSVLGLILGMVVLVVTAIMGTHGAGLGGFLDLHAFLIVVGGCTAACILAVNGEDLKAIGSTLKLIFGAKANGAVVAEKLVKFSEIARRDGILALEGAMQEVKDPLFRGGLQMMVDGSSADDIYRYFELNMEVAEEHMEHNRKVLECYEKWSPSFGLLGTLQGLISMLQNLEDPSTIGPSMGVAMVATFYGAFLAFMVGGPMSFKMKRAFEDQVIKNKVLMEGCIAIINGDSPRALEQKLSIYLPHAAHGKKH